MTPPINPVSTAVRGKSGEDAACQILSEFGIKVLQRNFRTARGEVDIIARDLDVLCFIEVKSWKRDLWPDLGLSINARKRQRIRSTALAWLENHRELEGSRQLRFDLFLYDPESGSHEWLPGALDY